MLRQSYILVIRNILKRKLSSFVIILSICIGLCVATILFAFIEREKSTDSFNTNKENIYRLISLDPFDTKGTLAFIKKDASEYIKNNFAEVLGACKVSELSNTGVTLDANNNLFERVMVVGVDTNFFNFFNLPLYKGNWQRSVTNNGIVISKNLAEKIYGNDDVLGQQITVQLDTINIPLTVTAILDNNSENSHLKFDALVSFSAFDSIIRGSSTYLLLNPRSETKSLENKISADQGMPSLIGPGKGKYYLQPLSEVYFDSANVRKFTRARNPNFITLSWIIIFLILVIAIFNFINLFVISLVERRKEFGIKMAQGATNYDIRVGIILEVLMYVTAAMILSMAITIPSITIFNDVFETNLSVVYFFNFNIIGNIFLAFVLITASLSYIITVYLNKIKPMSLISDNGKLNFKFNKLFFTLQFIISMTLIMSATVIIRQTEYVKNKALGFEKDILEVKLPADGKPGDLSIFKQALQQRGTFRDISISTGNPISGNQVLRYELGLNESYSPYFLEGDERLISTLNLQIESGAALSVSSGSDKVVNQKFIKYFNIKNPIGAIIPGSKSERIVGVVSDFNVSSLKQEIPLFIIGYKSDAKRILVNFSGLTEDKARSVVQETWKRLFPNNALNYTFLSDELLAKHKEDFYFGKIVITFAAISIFISCFGLFALAKSNCQSRGKEIAIRKSLGASTEKIIVLLVLDFGKWILLSFIFACGIGYYFCEKWIESFVYRINITWDIFILTAIIAIVVSLIAIASQTIKAAIANPINGLRLE